MGKLREEYRIYDNSSKKYLKNNFYTSSMYSRIWKDLTKLKNKVLTEYENSVEDIPDEWVLCSYNTETGYKEMKVKDLFDDSTNKTVV